MVKIGQRLLEERTKKGLTLDQISKDIKIKPQFLQAIEKGEYNKLPSPAYAQGFVRNYASYLGLPKTETVAFFKRDFDEKKALKVLPDSMVRSEGISLRRVNVRQIVLFLLLGAALFGFLFFQYRSIFFSPSISLVSPKPGSIVSKETIVKGKTDESATVIVNNEPVAVDSDGNFTKTLTLFPGKTKIVIKAKNRLGRETVLQEEITVKE